MFGREIEVLDIKLSPFGGDGKERDQPLMHKARTAFVELFANRRKPFALAAANPVDPLTNFRGDEGVGVDGTFAVFGVYRAVSGIADLQG